jgi:hypothetical protein
MSTRPLPRLKVLPDWWVDAFVEQARRGPGYAAAVATVVESSFTEPWQDAERAEAALLARWLRELASLPGTTDPSGDSS